MANIALTMQTVQRAIEEHYIKVNKAFEYDPTNPLIRFRITLMNGNSFEVLLTYTERQSIERTRYWSFIRTISGLGSVINQ